MKRSRPTVVAEQDKPGQVVSLANRREDPEAAVRNEETALLLRVRDEQDRGAYSEIFERFAPRLKAYLTSLSNDASVAETVVQEIMITVWTKSRLFDPSKASARTWLYTMARNRLIDVKRGSQREARFIESYTDQQDPPVDEVDRGASMVNTFKLNALLEKLPGEQAEVLMFAYVEGYSHREIAERLDLPLGTVKSRIRLAVERLRGSLGDDHAV
ncbi:MAG: sigma-70 family RNA polymerase sigma factor [Pseudomonadota bacterium]